MNIAKKTIHNRIDDIFTKPIRVKINKSNRGNTAISITLHKKKQSAINLKQFEFIPITEDDKPDETPFALKQKSLSSLFTSIKESTRNTDLDKMTSITSLRLSQSPSKFAFGRGLNRSESARFKTFTSNNIMSPNNNIKHNKKKSIASRQCPELPKKSIELFKSKPMIQRDTSGVSRYNKLFPIFTSKKKIPYIIEKPHDLDYKFNPDVHLYHSYLPMERKQRKKANFHMNAINQGIQLEYGRTFNLLNSNNYSIENLSKPPTLIKSSSSFLLKHSGEVWFKKYFTLRSELDNHLENAHKRIIANFKKAKYEKFKMVLLKAAMHFSKWGIDIHDFYNKRYYEVPPYKDNEIYRLICAIKENEVSNIKTILLHNKFVLLDTDFYGQTPLHWVSKRNMYKIISLMVIKGAKIDATDMINRTPLHIAAQMNNLEATILLLFTMANPHAKTNLGYKPFDLSTQTIIQFILKKAEEFHIQLKDMTTGIQMRNEMYRAMKVLVEVELLMPFNFFQPYIY